MLKIRGQEFQVKFCEVNLRQRMFEGESIVTVCMNMEFYPEVMDDSVVYGSVEVKVDVDGVKSLNDIGHQHFDAGTVCFNVCKDGVWESDVVGNLSISFGSVHDRLLDIELSTSDILFDDVARVVSLYTTSNQELGKMFDMCDFYTKDEYKTIGKSTILKYYLK